MIGDVRDQKRLKRAIEDIDIVFHAAALKHVPKVEYNPFEAIKTNVEGSQNVIDACLENNVERAVCIGTDKAVSPLNTYGATKLLMEKLFVTASNYLQKERHQTKFVALRYGNVLGSSGSVIPKFIEQIKKNAKITITDPSMTRFSISMNEALDFILNATEISKGSEIFIPKLKAYSISDIKNVLFDMMGKTGEEIIGIREGEKLNEVLINREEIRYSWEYKDMYMVLNPSVQQYVSIEKYDNASKVNNLTEYSSDSVERFSNEEMKAYIHKIQDNLQQKLNTGLSIDDILDKEDPFEALEPILPREVYAILVLAMINDIRSDTVMDAVLKGLSKGIETYKKSKN